MTTMKEYGTILLQKQDQVATLTLNRPERLNAVNHQLGMEVVDALSACEGDDDVRCIVLTGAGRSFCSGDDLRRDPAAPGFERRAGPDQIKNYVFGAGRWTVIVNMMHRLPKPIIGSIRGHAHGAGINLALGCDLRIASSTANFATPFIKWAMGTGVNQLSNYVGIGVAMEMVLTGDAVDAERALQLGLVNRVVPDDQLEAATWEWAQRFARGPTRSLGVTKAALYKGWGRDLDMAFDYQAVAQAFAGMTEDRQEGQKAFLEKRAPSYKGL